MDLRCAQNASTTLKVVGGGLAVSGSVVGSFAGYGYGTNNTIAMDHVQPFDQPLGVVALEFSLPAVVIGGILLGVARGIDYSIHKARAALTTDPFADDVEVDISRDDETDEEKKEKIVTLENQNNDPVGESSSLVQNSIDPNYSTPKKKKIDFEEVNLFTKSGIKILEAHQIEKESERRRYEELLRKHRHEDGIFSEEGHSDNLSQTEQKQNKNDQSSCTIS
jgi:hypothetical protein